MLRNVVRCFKPGIGRISGQVRRLNISLISNQNQSKDEGLLKQELGLTGVHLDEIDSIMIDGAINEIDIYYPNLFVEPNVVRKPFVGHNVMVIQPWASYANFGEFTEPELQLDECVSLANTIHNWTVVGKRILFADTFNRKQLVGRKTFENLKAEIQSKAGVSAVFFGLELLSGIQLLTLEKELQIAVYDRFTVVLNIFRQHARTKEAKIQLALAELPYIRSHLREIHLSSERSSAADSIKLLVGGAGDKFFRARVEILKKRERRLKFLLQEIRKHREVSKKCRRKSDMPLVSIVGYTNSGKTTLVKYLTQDKNLIPLDQLFATLDVTVHKGELPSHNSVLYLDTVGFLSRIPLLLVEAFSATLRDVQDSDLIIHVLDVTHPDHRLQYSTVIKALESLKISKNLIEKRLTIGNKIDLLDTDNPRESLPQCDLRISLTKPTNLNELVKIIDNQLLANLKRETCLIKVESGGTKYIWLRKNCTIIECQADETDPNYLICRVIMSPSATGRWFKQFGTDGVLSNLEAFNRRTLQVDS